jgi:hypothetical protein
LGAAGDTAPIGCLQIMFLKRRGTMRASGVVAILGIAAITMAATLGLLVTQPVTADGEAKPVKPTIANPKITVDGCQVTLSTDKPEYAPGETPVLTVVATNPTSEPVATSVSVSVAASSPASLMSRRLVLPTPVWTGECAVNLQPGETRSFTLETETAIPAGQMVSISMLSKDQAAILTRLHTPPVVDGQAPKLAPLTAQVSQSQ